jgi:hypothetical protein
MAWLKFDEGMAHDEKVLALPTDKARWAWVCILLGAKSLRPAGQYSSMAQLRAKVGTMAGSQVPHLLKTGLLVADIDGVLVIPGWNRWQIDPTANDRQQRHRARLGNMSRDNSRDVTYENRHTVDKTPYTPQRGKGRLAPLSEVLAKVAKNG